MRNQLVNKACSLNHLALVDFFGLAAFLAAGSPAAPASPSPPFRFAGGLGADFAFDAAADLDFGLAFGTFSALQRHSKGTKTWGLDHDAKNRYNRHEQAGRASISLYHPISLYRVPNFTWYNIFIYVASIGTYLLAWHGSSCCWHGHPLLCIPRKGSAAGLSELPETLKSFKKSSIRQLV